MAARYVNFDEIKARVTFEQLLTHYGLLDDRTQRKGDEIALHCIFHENDTTPSLKVNTAKNVFNCFACHQGGDVIGFVVLKEGVETGDETRDRRAAALLIQEWFNLTSKRPARPRRRSSKPAPAASGAGKHTTATEAAVSEAAAAPREEERTAEPTRDEKDAAPVNRPLTFTFQHLDATHPYLAARGLSPDTIAAFGLGFHAGRGIMHGRIMIPIHNEEGQLVAYGGRWPGEPPDVEPKYKLPPNFQKSLVLYNLHRAKEHAHEGLIVVEGFFSVFDFFQRGRKNVVAVMGSSLSEVQEQLLVDTVGPRGRVLLLFDDDPAGHAGMQEAAARLVSRVFCRTMPLQ